jgi:hypothetical protein
VLLNTLALEGMTRDDIQALDMDASAVVTAMLSGGVDACAIWAPSTLQILNELEGSTKLTDNLTFKDTTVSLSSCIALSEYIEENRETVLSFTRTLYKAMDYASQSENFEEVCGYVAKQTGQDVETVLDQEGRYILYSWWSATRHGDRSFFAEIEEPTEITLRTEWKSPDAQYMLGNDINCGICMKNMFDCFDYVGYSLKELLGKYKAERNGEIIIQSHMFTMKEIDIKEKKKIKVKDYAIVVVLEGKDKGGEFFITEDAEFIGNKKLLVCYGKEI